MKFQENRLFRWFIVIDILLNAVVLIGAANVIYITYDDLSFAGFMALFMLFLLVPLFFATALVLFFLIFHIRKNSPKLVLAAFVLQMATPILWVLFANALRSVGWLEIVMIAQSVVGTFGILLWLVMWLVMRLAKGKKNQ